MLRPVLRRLLIVLALALLAALFGPVLRVHAGVGAVARPATHFSWAEFAIVFTSTASADGFAAAAPAFDQVVQSVTWTAT